jgi:hypothetical protein
MNTPAKVMSILILNFIAGIQLAHGQKIVIRSRDEFSVSAAYCVPTGSKYRNQAPTILPNMQPGICYEASYLTSLPKNLHVGLSGSYTVFKGWSYPDKLFENSSVSITSFGPTLIYRTWSPKNTFFNKYNFFCGITSGLSKIKMMTDPDSGINEGSQTIPLEVNSLRLFVNASAGVYYNFSNTFAIILSAGYQQAQAKSQVFTDKHYSVMSFRLGTSIRLTKDKRYKLLN